jgi:DNA-3-methyladenine glycosylase
VTELARLLAGAVTEAAPALLGRLIVSELGGARVAVALTEVEAYGAADDPASHAYRGRTSRNAAMYGPPGTLYVYRSYGVHWCANVVCGLEGEAAAVLLRGGIVTEGLDIVKERRRRGDHLVDGPGKLAEAMAITGEHDGLSVLDGVLYLGPPGMAGTVATTPRIGVSRGADRRWRFVLVPADNPQA